jgi:GMP synthase-like glutamine amidotransferase
VLVHAITHVPFEGPALITEWARERGHSSAESLALTEQFPDLASVGLLVVMGGPMAADDHRANPWLTAEKRYITQAAERGIPVLGVCLGAQIIADVAGGRVRRNPQPEIGWFPVRRTESAASDPLFAAFPDELVAGHWHGDTFDLPVGAEPTLESDACANQAFSLERGRLVGLQFHLEWSPDTLEALVAACGTELGSSGTYISTAAQLRAGLRHHGPTCRESLWGLLDNLVAQGEESA